jgi:hypothetical protein
MSRTGIAFAALVLLALGGSKSASAQSAAPAGRLVITVVDQTGGVLPRATVTVTGDEDATRAAAIPPATASDAGVAVVDNLPRGRYTITAEFAGFETVTLRNVRVSGADTRRRITLPLKKLDEDVTVGRDGRSSGLDPRGDAFSTVLTREQIEALPDDPEEMEAVLKAMAPFGATIRVDGFTGGTLPHKSQIRSIRLPRLDSFAAENHGSMRGIGLHIDIMTQPGLGPLRGSADVVLRDDALNARNPFVPVKGDERLHRYGFSTSGTIVPQRSSFSLSASLTRQYDTDNLLAALDDGTTLAEPVRRPVDASSVNARFDQALAGSHALRVSYMRTAYDRQNLGIGGFSLPERGYSTESSQNALRVSENGAIGRRLFTESRFQFQWQDRQSASAFEAPAIRVLDTFTSGGAQQRGGRHVTSFELATDLDYVRGSHSMRTGILLEGASYRSDEFSNYLGTYTFASLDDYLAGRPRTYTRRIGDPNVRYSNLQAGIYWQDDWRVARSALVSYGVRYEAQTRVNQKTAFSPRVSASWSPFRAGHTTLRASAGYFTDWLDMDVYEQSLRVDGFRQQELQILEPSYPDPGGAGEVPPTNRYLLEPDRMTGIRGFTAGADRGFGQRGRVSIGYSWREGSSVLSGVNLNPPSDGVRPDPRFANVIEARPVGSARTHTINLGASLMRLDWRRTFFSTNYSWIRNESNSAGAFSLPASGADLSTEWGPSGPSHRFVTMLSMEPIPDISFSMNVTGQSGLPYNVTTGSDDNGDGLFNDRPAGTARNSVHGAAQWTVNGRLTYSIRLGQPRQGGGGGGTTVIRMGEAGGFGPGGGAGFRIDLYASAQNLLNHDNYVGYSGVMTSPFFARPTNVTGPRKIEAGVRFAF